MPNSAIRTLSLSGPAAQRLGAFLRRLDADEICALLDIEEEYVTRDETELARRLAQVVLAARHGATCRFQATAAGVHRCETAPSSKDIEARLAVLLSALTHRIAHPVVIDRKSGADVVHEDALGPVTLRQTRRGVLCSSAVGLEGIESLLSGMNSEAERRNFLARLLLQEVVVLQVYLGRAERCRQPSGALQRAWRYIVGH